METIWQDIRYSARTLAKSPAFALVAVLTLALGIGANTAIFSVANAALLRPLPYPDPDRLVMVWANTEQLNGRVQEWTNPDDLRDWRAQNTVFEEMAALGGGVSTLTGDGEPEQLNTTVVTYPMFRVLGVTPAMGRDFTAEDDVPNGPRVVILTHGLWQRRFGGDPNILGRSITFDDRPFTVIGVLPQGFRFPVIPTSEAFLPLQREGGRGNAFLRVIARLKPAATFEQARAEMDVIGRRLAQQYPDSNEQTSVSLSLLQEFFAGPARPALLLLLAAVGLVLLIACANVANLLMARSTARQREIAIRLALGAGRGRLVRQLLTESILVSVAGAVIGLLLAAWSMDFLIAGLPADGRTFFDVRIDRSVLLFTSAVALLTALFFGLAPALQASKPQVHDSLKDGGRAAGRGGRLRRALVVAEVALSLLLLVGAGLLIRSFSTLLQVDTGFNASNVLRADLVLPNARYPERPQVAEAYAQMVERLRRVGGVVSAAATSTAPLSGVDSDTGFRIDGRPEPKPNERVVAWIRAVTPDYFQTMNIPLHRGRLFTAGDGANTPRVVLANESFARKYFPGEDAVGKRIGSQERWREIVGIVGNVRNFALDKEEPPAIYLPHAQVSLPFMTLVVRSTGDPLALAGNVKGIVREIDPNLAVANLSTMDKVVAASVADRRWAMTLLGAFAALAILLAAIGLYGVIAFSVAQRTQEIGIRIALGAQRGDVLRMVLGSGMRLWATGVALGLVAAAVATRWMSSLLYGVGAMDPATFVVAPVLLAVVAILATVIPARRATRVDPLVALRYE